MKLVVSINNLTELESLKDLVDGYVCGNEKYALCLSKSFSNEELKEILHFCVLNNKAFFLKLDAMAFDDTILEFKDMALEFKSNNTFYIVQDLGVFELLTTLGLANKIIYDNPTMVCNKEDYNLFYSKCHAASMSNEIPFKDVVDTINYSSLPCFYKAFGYTKMFFSKRKLVSVYKEEFNLDFENKDLTLREETRNMIYPIEENELGTTMYRNYPLCYLKEALSLRFVSYVYLDSKYIDQAIFKIVVSLFRKAINGEMNVNDAFNVYENLGLEYQDGFIYEDTVYQKELL